MNQTKTIQASSSTLSIVGNSTLQLWRWWTGELKAMLPATVAHWIDGDAVATSVMVDASGLTIINADRAATKSSPVQRVAIDALGHSPVLRALIAEGRDQVRLVLSSEQALVKSITLPLATEENLREVVGFELDRHTPFTPDQAYYDVQIVRRDAQSEKILVALAVASKSEIASLVDTLRRAGLTCTAIGIDAHAIAIANAASFDLQPAFDKPPRRLSRRHLINLGLLGFVAALVFAAVILPIWQKREAVKALIPQAGKSGAEFLVSERVYSEYTKLVAEYNFLATRKHAAYPALAVLEELARTFADTTWVNRLDIKTSSKTREVILQGETQSASKVIENLEQSPQAMFQNSKQLTASTPMQPNTVRFHVSAEIKPRAVPAAESIDSLAAPAAMVAIPPPIATMPTATATVTSVPSVAGAPPTAPAQAQPASAAPPDPIAVKGAGVAPAAQAAPPPAAPLSTFNGPPPTKTPAPPQALPAPARPKGGGA